MVTHKDGRRTWIDDAVTSLRFLEEDRAPIELPSNAIEYVLGSADDCDVQLQDDNLLVSRHHARLSRTGATWTVHDLGSTNGVLLDGERRLSFELTPGAEIEIGALKLIADSAQLARLRAFAARVIGWDKWHEPAVDGAVRALRQATTRRAAFVLTGEGALTATARRLHALAFGEAQPFVVETVRRGRRKLRSERQWQSAGTICFVADDLPPEFATIVAANRMRAEAPRIMLCAASRDAAAESISKLESSVTVELPPLSLRPTDRDRLIAEYAADAVSALHAPGDGFHEHEMVWLQRAQVEGLDELDELLLRLVAYRNWGAKGGGRRLGISHVAMGRWLRRRGIPT
jgi:hypothetical protein